MKSKTYIIVRLCGLKKGSRFLPGVWTKGRYYQQYACAPYTMAHARDACVRAAHQYGGTWVVAYDGPEAFEVWL